MAVYKDEPIKVLHGYIVDGYNMRHSLALMINDLGPKITKWAEVVVEREIEGDEDPRDE